MIAFYYGLSGLACAVYYRRELLRSAKNFLFIGVAPLVGAGILFYLFAKSCIDLSDPENSYTGPDLARRRAAARDRRRLPPARCRATRALAAHRPRALLLAEAVRGGRPGRGRRPASRSRPRRSDGHRPRLRRLRLREGGARRRRRRRARVRRPDRRRVRVRAAGASCVGEEYKEHEHALHELGEQATADALARVREAEVELEVELVAEKPADALARRSPRARDARMIVVGTPRRGAARERAARLGAAQAPAPLADAGARRARRARPPERGGTAARVAIFWPLVSDARSFCASRAPMSSEEDRPPRSRARSASRNGPRRRRPSCRAACRPSQPLWVDFADASVELPHDGCSAGPGSCWRLRPRRARPSCARSVHKPSTGT